MRGALSNTPAPSCVRLLVGSQLLFLVEAWLMLQSRAGIGAGLTGLVILVSAVGIASLLAAIMGEPAGSAAPGWRRLSHGR